MNALSIFIWVTDYNIFIVWFCNHINNIVIFGGYMFIKFLVEKYLEKQGELPVDHTLYGESDMLNDVSGGVNIRKVDYHKTVLLKTLHKKGKVTILDNGDVMMGKKKVQQTTAPSQDQGSLF